MRKKLNNSEMVPMWELCASQTETFRVFISPFTFSRLETMQQFVVPSQQENIEHVQEKEITFVMTFSITRCPNLIFNAINQYIIMYWTFVYQKSVEMMRTVQLQGTLALQGVYFLENVCKAHAITLTQTYTGAPIMMFANCRNYILHILRQIDHPQRIPKFFPKNFQEQS